MRTNTSVNAYKYPNDIKWIKAHLINQVDTAIEEILNKLVYKVDNNGNVIFYNNVSINGDDTNYNITQLFEDVKHIREEIKQINNITIPFFVYL